MREPMDGEGRRASYSSLSMYRSCPQAWYYAKVRHLEVLEEKEPAVFRDFGSWWHSLRAAESLERGRRLGTLLGVPREVGSTDDGPSWPGETVVVDEVLEAVDRWWESRSMMYREDFLTRMGEPLPERIRAVDLRWRDRWAQDRESEEPLAVEFGWGRPLPPLPNDGEPNVMLVGYVDEVYYDRKRNLVVIRDHKAHKTLGTQSVTDSMMDSQLQLYAWGMAPAVQGWGLPPIRATGYDRVRSTKGSSPFLTLSGTLSKSTSDWDLQTYLEWVGEDGVPYPGRAKDGSGAGVYRADPAVIDRLSGPAARSAWFQRTLSPLSTPLVTSHLRAAIYTAIDQNRLLERTKEVKEAPRNFSYGCRWCDYSSLCAAEMVGGVDGDYVLSDHNLKVSTRRVGA